jgi:hypothetical protein
MFHNQLPKVLIEILSFLFMYWLTNERLADVWQLKHNLLKIRDLKKLKLLQTLTHGPTTMGHMVH